MASDEAIDGDRATPQVGDEIVRVTVFVRGQVQGVGFRWWTRSQALRLGLTGWARNTDDGRVEVVAEGPREPVAALVHLLSEVPSTARRPGRLDSVCTPQVAPPKGARGFRER